MRVKISELRTHLPSELSPGDLVRPANDRYGFRFGLVLLPDKTGKPEIASLDGDYDFYYWAHDDERAFLRLAAASDVYVEFDPDAPSLDNTRTVGSITVDKGGVMICLRHKQRGFEDPIMFSLTEMTFVTPRFEHGCYATYADWAFGIVPASGSFEPIFTRRTIQP